MTTPHPIGGDMLGTADEAERMEALRSALAARQEHNSAKNWTALWGAAKACEWVTGPNLVEWSEAALAAYDARKADQEAG